MERISFVVMKSLALPLVDDNPTHKLNRLGSL